MSQGPRPVRPRPSLASLALSMAVLPLGLAAQGVAPLPGLPPVQGEAQLPGLGEWLPLRPMPLDADKVGAVPLRLRGKTVQESPEGWTLEDGAVESPDLLLLADHIHYQIATGELQAEGHIRLEGPGIRLRCGRLRMDWKKRMGEAWALELELPPSWVLRSERVAFSTMKHWDFDQVELSPCPQEKPGWKAVLSRLTVDLDHYATLRNLWVWVGNVPTFYYLPWAIYPAKAERTSGLLPISFSLSGPLGTSLGLPYYQVLGPTADATLSPEYYAHQGFLWGGELRWSPEPTHTGSVQGQAIRQREDGEHRYRYSVKELWQREDGWQLSADLNGASDALLDADYGKGVGRLGTTSFDSALFVGKNFPWASINLTAAQQQTFFGPEDSSFYRQDYPASLKRRTLPSLQGRLFPIPVGSFYFDSGVQLTRLAYRLDLGEGGGPGGNYDWNRQDVFARLQGRLGQWGPFRADLQTQVRSTWYSSSLNSDAFGSGATDGPPQDPFKVDGPSSNRSLLSARLQLSAPPVGRTYTGLTFLGYSGELKHLMDPYFAFTENSQYGGEGRLPHFDEVDNTPGVNNSATGEQSLELGVKQHILGRGLAGTPFADLVRWRVAARYHFRPILLGDGLYKQGWASIDNDIDVEPNDKLRISFRRSSNVTDSSADNSLSADVKTGDGSRLNFAYFSTGINRFLVRQKGLQLGGLQRLWDDRWRLEIQSNYDFQNRGFASSQVGLAYMTPCVSTSLRFSHVAIQVPASTTKEDRLDLFITLRGLGDLGSYSLF